MLALLSTIFLLLVLIVSASLRKTYRQVGLRELKRRAQAHDPLAKRLHLVAAYGPNLQLILWIIIGLAVAGLLTILARILPVELALLTSVPIVWLAFAWLPAGRSIGFEWSLAYWLAPPLIWLLSHLQPVLRPLTKLLSKYRQPSTHSGLYQKDDLLDLLNRQKSQIDNRISKEELDMAASVLTFGDKLVRNFMTPRGAVVKVSSNDTIGPVLLNELHDSGHSRFPVYEGRKDKIIGTLYLHALVEAKAGGKVEALMSQDVYYVKDDQTLAHALDALLKTNHHLFVVVNSFEEMVGIITVEDILEQIIGRPIMDEFDSYQDLRAVAQLDAKSDRDSRMEL